MGNINTDLVLYLKLDTLKEGSVLDSSDSKTNGTVQGGVSLVPDEMFGSCLDFNGTTGSIQVPDSETLRIRTYTVEVWINPAQPYTVRQGIVGKPGRNFNLWLNDQANILLRFHRSGNTNAAATETPSGSIQLNQWNHVAVTNDGTVATTYINGRKAAQGSSDNPIVENNPLYIGMNLEDSSGHYFKGKLAHLRIYKRALSATEISQNIDADRAGLVAYFELDELTADDRVANEVPGIAGLAQAVSLVPDDTFGACLQFNGTTSRMTVDPAMFVAIANTFTLAGWVIPTATHRLATESTSGAAGTSGQRYMIYPPQGTATYGSGHACAGISVGTNGISVYEHAGDYMPPLLVWQQDLSSLGWVHVAVVYSNQQLSLYVNGQRVAAERTITSPQSYVHPSCDIGGGPWGYFQGKVANVRVYRRALAPTDIQKVMHADKLTLPAYRMGHPIDFSLLDEHQNYVLYISDDPKASHALNLELRNTATQSIQLQPGTGTQAAFDNYHFELVFRQGVLSTKTLTTLRDNRTSLLKDPTEWDIAVNQAQFAGAIQAQTDASAASVNRAAQTLSLYLLYKGSDRIFTPADPRVVALQNISAAASTGIRGTQVELRLKHLVYVDDVNSATPSPITGTRVQQLQITNQSGRQLIPLHVGFVGSNRILNDGSSSNTLKLRVTNTSKEALSLQGGQFILSFDLGSMETEWAIATSTDELKKAGLSIKANTISIPDVTGDQARSAEWIIEKEKLPLQTLAPQQYFEINLSGIKTSHPTGHTNLYIQYRIPGYWDGQFVCVMEKAPLLFYDASPTDRRVGIGITNPEALLDVGGVGHTDGKVTLQLRNGNDAENDGSTQLTFALADSGQYRHAIQTRHNRLSTLGNAIDFYVWNTEHDKPNQVGTLHAMTLDAGNVGIGTTTPQGKLDVWGKFTASKTMVGAGSLVSVSGKQVTGANTSFIKEIQPGDYIGVTFINMQGGKQYETQRVQTITNDALLTVESDFFWYRAHMVQKEFTIIRSSSSFPILHVGNHGKVGIGTTSPQNRLDVRGAVVIGGTYAGANNAPANGLLVEGNVDVAGKLTTGSLVISEKIAWTEIIQRYTEWYPSDLETGTWWNGSGCKWQCWKDPLGIVHLRGVQNLAVINQKEGWRGILGQLPEGYRPQWRIPIMPAHGRTKATGTSECLPPEPGDRVLLMIAPDGNISIEWSVGRIGWLSLDGITFVVGR